MTPNHICRICGNHRLEPVLSLGETPLANSLLSDNQLSANESLYPLELVFCPNCSLVQITETISPEVLFREYLYFSSYSETLLEHAASLARRLISTRQLSSDSLVVEIASNDGYMLKNYVQEGIPVLGIEPAKNIAKFANENGIRTWSEFFDYKLAEKLVDELKHADVLHANNVLAHVADLRGVVAGIARTLDADGIAVIEVPYVVEMIQNTEFDTIYHEHLCYFSLTALWNLFQLEKLVINDVEKLEIHGGSLRITVAHDLEPSQTVIRMLESEKSDGVNSLSFYSGYQDRVSRLREELLALLAKLIDEGHRIAAYGASAKGSTLLNYFGIDANIIEYIVDRSNIKQGLFTPGTHLPILKA